ncbi:hypothetical protein SAMN05428989_1946 [Pseudoxanthomonas sp. GM95]|uniref:hypothetical protein n=1 Tax=Pseudoxanthomonas sp. GM95 TaxID=1881043 RepID=UPI0008CABB07|nr:hypothetical protein [Pseudoxanthomonas sp. GM95]SEL56786.1 hypothetical protein SAMN05428989_1946 [Pseudoxanthomonas sp. GM95]
MVAYLFKNLRQVSEKDDQLIVSVRAALREIQVGGALYHEALDATETCGSDSGYVLMDIASAAGWQYQQASIFLRHGVSCSYFPDELGMGTC